MAHSQVKQRRKRSFSISLDQFQGESKAERVHQKHAGRLNVKKTRVLVRPEFLSSLSH